MKIRNGFVSNSSSSSFIIFWKKEIPFEELQKRIYEQLPKEDGLLKELNSNLKSLFTLKKENVLTEENYIEEGYGDDEKAVDKIKAGYNVYCGGFSDEDSIVESMLSWLDIFYETDDWGMIQEGGY